MPPLLSAVSSVGVAPLRLLLHALLLLHELHRLLAQLSRCSCATYSIPRMPLQSVASQRLQLFPSLTVQLLVRGALGVVAADFLKPLFRQTYFSFAEDI